MNAVGYVILAAVVIVVAWIAIVVGRRRARRGPDMGDVYHLGLNAMIAGDADAAVRHLKAAVKDDPRNIDAYIKLGNLLRGRGQTKQAIQVHRELLVKRRLPKVKKREILMSLALDLAQAKKWSELRETLRLLSRADRAELPMLALARDASEGTGEFDKAVQIHKDILKANAAGEPSLGVYRAHVALLALKSGDTARAKSGFQAAARDSEDAALANVYLGDMALQDDDLERAVVYWMKVVNDGAECAHLVFDRLEKAYFDLGDFGRMLRVYEDVVSRAPGNVAALIGLSKMLERKGSIDEAIRTANEAIKHEGDGVAGHRRLIELLMATERYQEAAEAAQALLERLADGADAPTCDVCGQRLSEPCWRCPECRAWIHAC